MVRDDITDEQKKAIDEIVADTSQAIVEQAERLIALNVHDEEPVHGEVILKLALSSLVHLVFTCSVKGHESEVARRIGIDLLGTVQHYSGEGGNEKSLH